MKKTKVSNCLLYVLMVLTIFGIIILKPIDNLDELWNYNFARNMANGLVPYKNFSMLQMPLLPIICGIILRIISNELIIMRIIAAFMCAGILYCSYTILNKFNIKKEISIIFVFLIGWLLKDYFCIDYNFATLLVTLIIINIELLSYQKNKNFFDVNLKTSLLIGFLAGLTIGFKQTSGLLICVATLGNKLLFVKNKNDFKNFLKDFLFKFIGILIPVTLILLYLFATNSISDFISYTLKGISSFSNMVSYKNLIRLNLIGILAILVPLSIIYYWIKTIIMEKNKEQYLLLVYGLSVFVIAFPISDNIHFLIAAVPFIILIQSTIYNIAYSLYKKLFRKEKGKKFLLFALYFITTFAILISIIFGICNLIKYYNKKDSLSKLLHYKYIPINNTLEDQINRIDKYILDNEKETKILDATAAIYMIPINRYNKNYDMLLKGNLGENGEENLKQEIGESKNTQYLILKDKFNKNWQTPLDVIEYVKTNKNKIGEIEIFDIYE